MITKGRFTPEDTPIKTSDTFSTTLTPCPMFVHASPWRTGVPVDIPPMEIHVHQRTKESKEDFAVQTQFCSANTRRSQECFAVQTHVGCHGPISPESSTVGRRTIRLSQNNSQKHVTTPTLGGQTIRLIEGT
jgi:hypothetical protein